MTTTQYIVQFLIRFIGLIPGYTFLIGCFFLWRQTYRISRGHKWLGELAWIALVIANVLYTVFPPYGMMFRPVVNTFMTAWVIYNGWFFFRYPIPWKYLQAGVNPERRGPLYKPKTKLGTILIRPVQSRPFWFTTEFKWVGIIFFFLLISAYFIIQLADVAVESDRKVVEAKQEVKQTAENVKSAVSEELKAAVAIAVDTLQDQAKARTVTDSLKVANLEKKVDENTVGLSQGLSKVSQRVYRTDAKASRALNSPIFPVIPLRPKGPTGEIPTSKVQDIPPQNPPRRWRKTSYNEGGPFDADEVARAQEY